MTNKQNLKYEASKQVYDTLEKLSTENPEGLKGIMSSNVHDIYDGHGISAYEHGQPLQKAKRGISKIKGIFENAENNIGILTLEGLANLYSKGMLADPNLSSEQQTVYGIVAGVTGVDALLRIVTGCGIDTYVKGGAQKFYHSLKSRFSKNTSIEPTA